MQITTKEKYDISVNGDHLEQISHSDLLDIITVYILEMSPEIGLIDDDEVEIDNAN